MTAALFAVVVFAACSKGEVTRRPHGIVSVFSREREVIIGARTSDVIAAPTRVRAYQIMSPFDRGFDEAKRRMRLMDDEYPILSETAVPANAATHIAALLLDASSYDPAYQTDCNFDPHHALRFERGQDVVDVVICFHCNDLDIVPAPPLKEPRTTQPFGKIAEPLYGEVTHLFPAH